MGMGLDIAAVDYQPFEIRIIHHRLQQSGPHSTVSPVAEAPVGVLPVSVVRRQIPPGHSGQGTPVRKIQHTASMNRRLSWAGLPCLPSPPGRCGRNRSQTSSVIPWRRCAARILPTLPTRSNPSPSHGFDDTSSVRRRVRGFPRTSVFLMQGQRRWPRWR